MFDIIFKKLRDIKIVAKGFEIYRIAKEVYKEIKNSKESDSLIEGICLNPATEVVYREPNESVKRIDCKVIAKLSSKYRCLKNKLSKNYSLCIKNVNKVRTVTKFIYYSTKNKVMRHYFHLKALAIAFFNKTKNIVNNVFFWVINRISDSSMIRSNKRFDCFLYNSLTLIQSRFRIILKCIKKITIRFYLYFTNVFLLNDKSLKQTANYSYYSACNGIKTNWQLFLEALKLNEQLLTKYFSELDLEIYYTPEKCMRLKDIIKEYIEEITLDIMSQEDDDNKEKYQYNEDNEKRLETDTVINAKKMYDDDSPNNSKNTLEAKKPIEEKAEINLYIGDNTYYDNKNANGSDNDIESSQKYGYNKKQLDDDKEKSQDDKL